MQIWILNIIQEPCAKLCKEFDLAFSSVLVILLVLSQSMVFVKAEWQFHLPDLLLILWPVQI